ncbi:ABC transporter substrate-binding protein [Actinomadura syzygii]|uniref:ABC transporter substrate-binding protein n=2 Tax=Actinomadura syzygii TaxID=1427538 RepID=A0A5D0ULI8_9ACTN|nr:ABC transporter substrate-binding protein [Actinomadura syzygii]
MAGKRMGRGMLGALALTTAATLAVAGCSGSGSSSSGSSGTAARGGALVVADDSQPLSGLDPIMAQAFNAKRMVAQFYEGLLALDTDTTTLKPAVAESWKQVSPTEYEFTLRKGVTFHDGTPVKATDVVFSLKRIVDPKTHSPYVSLYTFKDVKAVGEDKVTITLKEPQASLLHLLAQPWSAGIVSEQWTKSKSENERKTQENGTGPYKLAAYQEGSLIKTVKFAGYWDKPKPGFDAIDYRLIPDESTRVQALQSGSVDMTQVKLPKNVEALKRRGINVGPTHNVGSYWLGMNAAQGPLANEKVRKAISVGIDRQQLIKIGSQGVGELAGIVPPADPLGAAATADFPNYTYNQAEAKKLLAESGAKDVKLTVALQSEIPEILPTAQLMKQQLSEIGIELEIKQLPFGQLVGNLLSGKWNADMIQLTAALNADASQYLALWFAKGIPSTKIDDPKLWQMMSDAVTKAKDDAERKRMYAEINRYVAERVYMVVPYAAPIAYDVWGPKLKKFEADPSGTRIFLKNS